VTTLIKAPALKLSLDDEAEEDDAALNRSKARRTRVLLVGGLYGGQPLGREILLRLARHIGEGVKQGENALTMVLKRTVVYIVPAVDMENFAAARAGSCHYTRPEEDLNREAGNQFFEGGTSKGAEALRTLMTRVQFDLAVSLEGNGMFIRVPPDGETSGGDDSASTGGGMETIDWLAATYFAAHSDMANNTDPCRDRTLNGHTVPAGAFPTGVLAGRNIHPAMYGRHSFLDYAWRELGVPAFAAHISCCNYPRAHTIPAFYKANMIPLVRMLTRAQQGVWGLVLSAGSKKSLLPDAEIRINGRRLRADDRGEFLAVLPTGAYKLEATAPGHAGKQLTFSVESGFMTRRDVILESSAASQLEYHTGDQLAANLRSLEVQYPDLARLYIATNVTTAASSFYVIQIGGGGGAVSPKNDDEIRPPVRLLGRGILGAEIAANLADWLVTRLGHADDTATALLSRLDLHIGILLEEAGSAARTPSSELCTRGQAANLSQLMEEPAAVAAWAAQQDFLVGLDMFGGSDAILPSQVAVPG
jgi:hypothetical protein